jgi:hypothetical protein
MQELIAYLKAEYGEDPVKAEVNRGSKPKRIGRPEIRNYIRLFALWIMVKASSKLNSDKIDRSCQFIAKMGGVFEYTGEYDSKLHNLNNYESSFCVWVQKSTTIKRLYYIACKKFDEYEERYKNHFRPRLKLPPLRERLLVHADQLADNEINVVVVHLLSAMSFLYVHCHLYLDGTLVLPDFPGFEPLPRIVVRKDRQELGMHIDSLFEAICGEDGRGAVAFMGPPRPIFDAASRPSRS